MLLRKIIAPALCVFQASLAQATDVGGSIFDADYKCVEGVSGGFVHNESGHHLTSFVAKEVYYLVHFSNIPDDVIVDITKDWWVESPIDSTDSARKIFEERTWRQKGPEGTVITEENSYYILRSSDNPKKSKSYSVLNRCDAYGHESDDTVGNIICDGISYKFSFTMETGRFMLTLPGGWVDGDERKLGEITSSFSFGECEEYYR